MQNEIATTVKVRLPFGAKSNALTVVSYLAFIVITRIFCQLIAHVYIYNLFYIIGSFLEEWYI